MFAVYICIEGNRPGDYLRICPRGTWQETIERYGILCGAGLDCFVARVE